MKHNGRKGESRQEDRRKRQYGIHDGWDGINRRSSNRREDDLSFQATTSYDEGAKEEIKQKRREKERKLKDLRKEQRLRKELMLY